MFSVDKQRILKKRKGFTLVEIIVCCAIIIALSSAAFIGADNALHSGRYHTARTEVSSISVALAQYHFEVGSLPTAAQGLAKLTTAVGNKGPWLSQDNLVDPWGHNYQYSVSGNSYAVYSLGKNNKKDITDANMYKTFDKAGDDIGVIGFVTAK